MNKLKRSGLSKQPFGTPATTTSDELALLFMTTFYFSFAKNCPVRGLQYQRPWMDPYITKKSILFPFFDNITRTVEFHFIFEI